MREALNILFAQLAASAAADNLRPVPAKLTFADPRKWRAKPPKSRNYVSKGRKPKGGTVALGEVVRVRIPWLGRRAVAVVAFWQDSDLVTVQAVRRANGTDPWRLSGDRFYDISRIDLLRGDLLERLGHLPKVAR